MVGAQRQDEAGRSVMQDKRSEHRRRPQRALREGHVVEVELGARVAAQGDLFGGFGEEQRAPVEAEAAKAGILARHIIPNTLGPVVVFVTLLVPKAILLESLLSFLGLGVQEPLTSLGLLISEGASNMRGALWLLIWPAITLTLILFALNFLGDGLRDSLDPKDR